MMAQAKKPKTAYDIRRYKVLVDVLASDSPMQGMKALADSWGVTQPDIDNDELRLFYWKMDLKCPRHNCYLGIQRGG